MNNHDYRERRVVGVFVTKHAEAINLLKSQAAEYALQEEKVKEHLANLEAKRKGLEEAIRTLLAEG